MSSRGASTAAIRRRERQVEERAVPRAPGIAHDVHVSSWTRREDADIDPPSRCSRQQVDEAALRGEVRVGDVQRLSGAGD
jgi:hypothetical protein